MVGSTDTRWDIVLGNGPIVATAIHDGHGVREDVAGLLALRDEDRLREEDPYTAPWTAIASTRIVCRQSRFEVDLNRPRDKAVYIKPEDAWGLHVWKSPPTKEQVRRSLAEYDDFYTQVRAMLTEQVENHGLVVVLDLHTYNHRRLGPTNEPADPDGNPEVNIGTGTVNRERFGLLVDRFMTDLSAYDFMGRRLDVRENVKFKGGRFSRWIHETFPGKTCAIAIEFKKFFMDEWTGKLFEPEHQHILKALKSTIPGIHESLKDSSNT